MKRFRAQAISGGWTSLSRLIIRAAEVEVEVAGDKLG